MPRRRGYKRRRVYRKRGSFKRKFFRRRYRSKGSRISRVRERTLYTTDRRYVKLRFTTVGTATNAVSNNINVEFRGNSIFKPSTETGNTKQPTGRDQWFGFYQNVVVLASKITVYVTTASAAIANSVDHTWVTVWPYTGLFPAISYYPQQQPYARYKLMTSPLNGNGVKKVSNFMTTKKIFARGGQLVEDDWRETDTSQISADNEWRWRVNFSNDIANSSGDPTQTTVGPYYYTANIKYYCVFVNRVPIGAS